MRRAETWMAVGLIVLAALLLRQALRLSIGWTIAGPGSGFFPFWLSLGVGVCAVAVFAQSLRVRPRPVDDPFIPSGAWKPLLVVFLPMAAVVGLIRYFGIYLGGALYLLAYTRLVGRHHWATVLLVSVLVPLSLFMIFERWFLLLMPKGIILEYFLYGR